MKLPEEQAWTLRVLVGLQSLYMSSGLWLSQISVKSCSWYRRDNLGRENRSGAERSVIHGAQNSPSGAVWKRLLNWITAVSRSTVSIILTRSHGNISKAVSQSMRPTESRGRTRSQNRNQAAMPSWHLYSIQICVNAVKYETDDHKSMSIEGKA